MRTASVKLLAFPEDRFSLQAEISGNTRFAGATAQVLTPSLAQELGVSQQIEGIALVEVVSGSPAARMGLLKGDIILSLNGQKMSDLDRFGSLAATRPRVWQMVLQRGNRTIRSSVRG
jgi:S1-C subfamily serine protease